MAQIGLVTAQDLVGLSDEFELYEGAPREVASSYDVSVNALDVAAMGWNEVGEHDRGSVFDADASFRLTRDSESVWVLKPALVRAEHIFGRTSRRSASRMCQT